jgi:hypothetical protein
MAERRESYAVPLPTDAVEKFENALGLATLSPAGNVVVLKVRVIPDPRLRLSKEERVRWSIQPGEIHGPERG